MPLPVDVGRALAAYLRDARPAGFGHRHVFLALDAPHRPLGAHGVSSVVARAAANAGIAQPVGAHRLRHTAAGRVLAGGGGLVEVGQLLRRARYRITESKRGERVAWFDPFEVAYRFDCLTFDPPDWPELGELVELGDQARRQERHLPMLPACLAIVELHTGVRVRPDWLRTPLRTFTLAHPTTTDARGWTQRPAGSCHARGRLHPGPESAVVRASPALDRAADAIGEMLRKIHDHASFMPSRTDSNLKWWATYIDA